MQCRIRGRQLTGPAQCRDERKFPEGERDTACGGGSCVLLTQYGGAIGDGDGLYWVVVAARRVDERMMCSSTVSRQTRANLGK